MIRNGKVELISCWVANSFQAFKSVGSLTPRIHRMANRKANAISERAEMKVMGGIVGSASLASG
ncbi:hypothetical protein ABIF67_008700 [Bradyrhizobium japonicum]